MAITPLEKWIAGKIGISGRPDLTSLRAFQLQKLRETLETVKTRSRFYKEKLSGFDPGSIVGEDIACLPFTYPEEIAASPNDFICVSPREIEWIVTLSTSGTTGSPKRIFFTDDDQELTVDFFHRGMTTLTDETDRVIVFMPGSTPGSVGDPLKKGLGRFGCESVVYGPIKDYDDALRTVIEEKITCIVGIPSQVLALSRHRGAGPVKLKSVLLSADYVSRAAVNAIEETWGASVYGHYGMTEMGLGGGVECIARHGYHLREADLLFEIVDPATGLPVPDGAYGEVVFTTLTRRAMPLIRYRTGDRARFLTEPCPCGTVLRRLDSVTGRLREAVTLADGNALSITELDEVLLADPAVAAYSAELRTKDGRDCLEIRVRAAGPPNYHRLENKLRASLARLFTEERLILDLREGDVSFFTTGTLKRKIADLRHSKGSEIK